MDSSSIIIIVVGEASSYLPKHFLEVTIIVVIIENPSRTNYLDSQSTHLKEEAIH